MIIKECAIDTFIFVGEANDRTDTRDDVFSDNTHTGIEAELAPAHSTVSGEIAYEMTIHEDFPDSGTPRFRNELRTRYNEILGPEIYFSYTVELGADFIDAMPDRHVLWQFLDTPVFVPHNYLRAGGGNFYFQHDIGDNPDTKRIDLGPYSPGIHKFIFYIYLSDDPDIGRVKIWKDGQVARAYEDFTNNKTVISTSGSSHYDYPPATTGTFPNQVVDGGVTCSLVDYFGRTLPTGATMDMQAIRWQIGLYQPSGTWQLPSESLTIWVSNLKWALVGTGETEQDVLNQLTQAVVNIPPTVSITAPAGNITVEEGSDVTLTATASDSDGTVSFVRFYDGETLIVDESTAPYSYLWTNLQLGTHTITSRATDNSGEETTSDPVVITVESSNVAPVAVISASTVSGEEPLTVNFTGDGSTDDVGIVSYFWDFKDGTTSTEANPTHIFQSGSYDVSLLVTDGGGLTDEAIQNINVTVAAVDTYNLEIRLAAGGTATEITSGPYIEGANVEVRANAAQGYQILEWEIELSPDVFTTVGTGLTNYSFTIPGNDVSIKPIFTAVPVSDPGYIVLRINAVIASSSISS